jgi:hypothetical protein
MKSAVNFGKLAINDAQDFFLGRRTTVSPRF